MASTKISNMPPATSVTDADVTPIVQGGANKSATFAVILAYISSALSAVSTFLGLSDTPSSYAGGAGKVVSVKSDESGLEFTTPSSLGAPDSAHYVTTQAESGLSAEFNLGGLTGGLLKQTVAAGVATPAIAGEGTDYLGPARIDDTAYDATTWNGDTTHAPSKNAVRDKFESLPSSLFDDRGNFTFGLKRSSGITTGKLPGYWTADFTGTISAWNITVDAGTITLKIWKIATGTAHPTAANSINTSGISLSSNTNIHSVDLSDFTTLAVTYGDVFALEVTAVSGVYDFGGSVEINKA